MRAARSAKARWVLLSLAGAALSTPALGYGVEGVLEDGCHERIASSALRAVRASGSWAPAIEPDDDERALIDDLPFSLPSDLEELAAATLLLAVRDNDLKGSSAQHLDSLARVHGDPAFQREHCLRRPEHDEPDGSARALEDCRAFVREHFIAALDGLDGAGVPDPSRREELEVSLAIRGRIDVPLPLFWIHIGHAMHTLEDSFAHTYRTATGRRVTTVLNWVDVVEGVHEERRDGPPHVNELDRCDDPDALRMRRRVLATDASVALLRAALDPGLDRAGKELALEDVLERYLAFEPGCTFDNGWCDAPERAYVDFAGCECRAGRPAPNAPAVAASAALVLAAWARRRARPRADRRDRPRARRCAAGAAAATMMMLPLTTWAQPETTSSRPPRDGDSWHPGFGLQIAASGAYDNLAVAAAVGARYRLTRRWTVGIDAEYNPFLSLDGDPVRAGVVNGYVTVIRRWSIGDQDAVHFRTTGNVGSSMLVMDLYGAPAGTFGLYLGASFLGVEWRASRSVGVILEPISIAVPMPQLSGIPFIYQQYRTTFAVEFAP